MDKGSVELYVALFALITLIVRESFALAKSKRNGHSAPVTPPQCDDIKKVKETVAQNESHLGHLREHMHDIKNVLGRIDVRLSLIDNYKENK